MTAEMIKVLTFTAGCAPYKGGDMAGFSPDHANDLLRRDPKVAEWHHTMIRQPQYIENENGEMELAYRQTVIDWPGKTDEEHSKGFTMSVQEFMRQRHPENLEKEGEDALKLVLLRMKKSAENRIKAKAEAKAETASAADEAIGTPPPVSEAPPTSETERDVRSPADEIFG